MTRFNTPSYEIPRTTGQCASTGRNLEPGEAYYAALVEISEQEQQEAQEKGEKLNALGVRRIDCSVAAWEGGNRPGDDVVYCFWKSTVPAADEKKKLFVDNAVLMNLLERLADTEQEDRLAFRYVIALILMRKRLVRYDGAATKQVEADGQTIEQTWWTLTPKLDLAKGPLGKWNPEAAMAVLDPKLDESHIEQVTSQLGEILDADL
jgi:hypothetical protein